MKPTKSGVTVAFNYDKWFEAHTGHDNDVVKVIRCKDCKYWYKGKNINYCRRFWDDDGEPKLYRCTADDYCSGAERKEE